MSHKEKLSNKSLLRAVEQLNKAGPLSCFEVRHIILDSGASVKCKESKTPLTGSEGAEG